MRRISLIALILKDLGDIGKGKKATGRVITIGRGKKSRLCFHIVHICIKEDRKNTQKNDESGDYKEQGVTNIWGQGWDRDLVHHLNF